MLGALLAVAAAGSISACASTPAATATPAPAVAKALPAAPTVSQTCPDASDGPSIVVQAVEDARHAMAANPSGPVPPVCLVTAFARIPVIVPDSIIDHTLGIAAELDRRGAAPRELLMSEITLLSRARRYPDVTRAYRRLVAIDPQPPMDVGRLALAAAFHDGDTTALLHLLAAAASRPDASPPIRTEHTVLQQTGALRSAIAEARGFIRQNPKYPSAYPSLVGNFGTLGITDSVVAYIGRGLKQGATRTSLMPALDPFVNTMLRHASLYGSSYGWDAQIAAAVRVDSALTMPSTKFLVAALIIQASEPQIAELGASIEGSSLGAAMPGAAATSEAVQQRASACRRIPAVASSLDVASTRLRDGGDRYSGGGVQQLGGALSSARDRLTALQAVCARAP
ncbi:MAG TPA: hypothetical protein VHV78_10635 [Gemmatimonadaceae bacterium]|nr:hypothetical protein [Gemmatimonadaceae bacterium]